MSPTSEDTTTAVPHDASAFAATWDRISGARRVLVLTHAHPDADAVSSAVAVVDARAHLGLETVAAVGDGALPENLSFLPGAEQLSDPGRLSLDDIDLIVLVDCADPERLGPLFKAHSDWLDGRLPVVNIDHHVTNARYGTTCLVDPTAAATAEILALMFIELRVPIHPDTATCLEAGVYGDTLGLKTPSTTSRTIRVAAELLDAGADLTAVVDNLFRIKPFSTVKLWGDVLSRAERLGDLVWTEITPAMFEKTGATPAEGEGIVNFIAGTAGARAAAVLYRYPDGWRVSLRSISEEVDVARLASLWGGGGHARAAGCTLKGGDEARDAFLRDLSIRVSASPAAAPTAQ